MMYGKGKGWFDGFGDGYTGQEGNGSGQSTKEKVDYYGIGDPITDSLKKNAFSYNEEASCTRLLTDSIEDINFYICQSYILNNKKETK